MCCGWKEAIVAIAGLIPFSLQPVPEFEGRLAALASSTPYGHILIYVKVAQELCKLCLESHRVYMVYHVHLLTVTHCAQTLEFLPSSSDSEELCMRMLALLNPLFS